MYTLFTLFREYTYIHTIEGRRGIERLLSLFLIYSIRVLPSTPLKKVRGWPDASVKKVRGRPDVSGSYPLVVKLQLTIYCHYIFFFERPLEHRPLGLFVLPIEHHHGVSDVPNPFRVVA